MSKLTDRFAEMYDEQDLKDRFFLEELWKTLNDEFGVPLDQHGGWKTTSFLSDWLAELCQKTLMTKKDRADYIAEQFNPEWFMTWEELQEAIS